LLKVQKKNELNIDLFSLNELNTDLFSLNPFASSTFVKPKQEHVTRSSSPFSYTQEPEPVSFTSGPRNVAITANLNDPTTSGAATSTYDDAISKLVDVLSHRQEREHLPRQEPEIFDGNLLKFSVAEVLRFTSRKENNGCLRAIVLPG